MKIIGKNSFMSILYRITFVIFLLKLLHLLFTELGFLVIYINKNLGTHLLSDTFKLKKFTALDNEYTIGIENFQFSYPLYNMAMIGDYDIITFISMSFYFLFYAIFVYCLYRIFKDLSQEIVFNTHIIKHLKIFGYINIIFIPFCLVINFFENQKINPNYILSGQEVSYALLHLAFGLIIFLMLSLIKKAHELQAENELTI
ncbi:DUF2975 domain-containing protein [Chryseobacterium binzhouense]|uniref:DUF2975 domain-containing protein n=1 Tax=Chryseobacterium binzhouense TaxID=2593646 RepID=UPI00289711F2|nr:DUF2975 domain-containing protein [Chryseobacterium binzhouense]